MPKSNRVPSDSPLLRMVPEPGTKVDQGIVRSYSDPAATGVTASTARKAIEKFIAEQGAKMKTSATDLREVDAAEGSATLRIRYQQYVNDLPVFGSGLHAAADIKKAGVIRVENAVDASINGDGVPDAADARSLDDVVSVVALVLDQYFGSFAVVSHSLGYIRDDHRPAPLGDVETLVPRGVLEAGTQPDGSVHLAYELRVETAQPAVVLRVLADARDPGVLWIESLTRAVTATLQVFMPDPVSESNNIGLGPASNAAALNPFRHQVQAEVNPAVGGTFRLEGDWVRTLEFESPAFAPPVEAIAAFEYETHPADRRFLSTNSYYWIDRFARYVRTLGVATLNANMVRIDVDAQAESGADNSHWNPMTPPKIHFGEGGVPDAADLGVIIHEYTHGLFDWLGSSHGGSGSYEHSLCDAIPAIFRDRVNPNGNRRTDTFPFDNVGNLWSAVRTLNRVERFDDAGFGGYDFNLRNSMLGTALWESYLGMGGDSGDVNIRSAAGDAMIRTMLEMLLIVPDDSSTAITHAQSLAHGCISADAALTGGLFSKVMDEAFIRRGLWGRRPIDLYISDSPADVGDIPSPIPHWTSPDIWVRNADVADGDDPELGHQPPINAVPNYLYVRVHNRGTAPAAAGAFSLEAFRCDPGTGMIWPTHFQSLGSLVVNQPIPAGGVVRVGPFIWTPQIVGHECLLAVVHGADDPAVTATLTTPVRHDQLVRFDNNVGQRNVSPQMAVPGGKVKFSLSLRGGIAPSSNDWELDAGALPADTMITIKTPHRMTDDAAIVGFETTAESRVKTTMTLAGGQVGRISGFALEPSDRVGIEIVVDFSHNAEHLAQYPLVATQYQDGEIAGRLTMQITAVKELDDFFFGNPRSQEVHVTTCPFWTKLGPSSKVPYERLADAIARGYNGCAYCLPDADTDGVHQ